MRLKSEFVEIDKVIHDDIVERNYEEDGTLTHRIFTYDREKLSIRCNIFQAPGLHIVESQINTDILLTNHWHAQSPHVRFFFYLKGNSHVINGAGNESYTHRAGMLQRNFLDTDGGGGTIFIKPGEVMHSIIIKMSTEFYISLIKSESWIIEDSFHQYILSKKPKNRPNETLSMDLRMLQIIQEILESNDIVEHRYHFLKLKLRELLFTIHQQTQYGTNSPEVASQPSDSLEKIKSYLALHLDNPPTSVELAKIFFMNEKKLKQNFKAKYGTTLYAYVVQLRMEKAKKLLLENHNVNELAILLGYHSVSHFIKVFKNYYGCTPKEALSNFRDIAQQ
ncbi:helix-turn-helix transcriptional regulator [Sphingobacterium paucimobilis]|uniref:HTH araC/xylS-type domain-containing protein n=1 Tax=Sphingobacterium paucimobilis HER1398 TaxID=1346330 RepID=U2HCM5_9SPHI|nr:AraC family transcriptional regulator [Sphingobacterium paucimobilis]ERJ59496.1 hypothetical protein M472_12005 [Sphingobacterium paucimobilis HER1398]